jgi:beta-glucosidase
MTTLRFPEGFVWGTATAAYQIEGAAEEDGRRPSIWDTFAREPGNVRNGDTGDVACDHYHRLDEDLDLIAQLRIPAYRFSVSWPRVVPDGTGKANQIGLDFYQRLVDGLLTRGITPLVTLYHWDLPQALQDSGGWVTRSTADHFAEYASLVGETLGDRVGGFTTLNEPFCSAFLGYGTGEHAPGIRDNAAALTAAHHLNLAHGRAVSALRSVIPSDRTVSVTLNLMQVGAASDTAADVGAQRHVDQISNQIWLEPMLRGRYPSDLIADTQHITDWAFVGDDDLNEIAEPIDVLGVNYYSPSRVAAPPAGGFPRIDGRILNGQASTSGTMLPWPGTDLAGSAPQPGPYTAMGWPIDASAMTRLLLRLRADYPEIPMVVTENGCAYNDVVTADGSVQDTERITYLRDHLAAIHAAIEAGADVRGYYVWSLLDNFEWAWGYSKRFGIVHVDYQTLERVPKDSALWFRDVVTSNSVDT